MSSVGWSVRVDVTEYAVRTIFQSGVQEFQIADCRLDFFTLDEAMEHCKFMQSMFLKALANIGVSR